MSGRAGLGLAQGFMQGYDFMQRIDEREQRMGLRNEQNRRATESHRRQGERHDLTMDQARDQREQQQAQQILGKISHGLDLADEEYDFLKQNPKYWPALDPQTDKSLETAKAVMDPNSPVSMRSPETLDAVNQLFGHRINRGEGGRKRIDGIYPGRAPGSVVFSLEVEGEDGRKYRAPMTVNRGTAGDDEVLQTPVEDLLGQVKGYDMLRQSMRTPEAQAQAQKVLMALTGQTPQRTKGVTVNDRLVNPYTGEVMGDYRDPNGGDADWARLNNGDLYNKRTGEVRRGVGSQSGSAGQAPADVRTAEWLVANGVAGDLSEAYELVSTSKNNPATFISRYVSAAARNQEDMYGEDRKSLRELTEEARQVYQEVVAPRIGGGNESGLAVPEPIPESAYAQPSPDGGMQGQVYRGGGQQPAPPEAVDHLRNNPQLADQFRAKYGYLPEGF